MEFGMASNHHPCPTEKVFPLVEDGTWKRVYEKNRILRGEKNND